MMFLFIYWYIQVQRDQLDLTGNKEDIYGKLVDTQVMRYDCSVDIMKKILLNDYSHCGIFMHALKFKVCC